MENLRPFFEAIGNNRLWDEGKLIKYAVKICMINERSELNGYYRKFNALVYHYDLHGTTDITSPIHDIYHRKLAMIS